MRERVVLRAAIDSCARNMKTRRIYRACVSISGAAAAVLWGTCS